MRKKADCILVSKFKFYPSKSLLNPLRRQIHVWFLFSSCASTMATEIKDKTSKLLFNMQVSISFSTNLYSTMSFVHTTHALFHNSKMKRGFNFRCWQIGQCNFLRQRDRSSFIVPGQWDRLKILPRDGMAQDSVSKSGMERGTVPGFDSLFRPVGQNGTEQKRTF